MPASPALLARGPWTADQVQAAWREDRYEPPPEIERMADGAVAALRERGSPTHDGVAGRLADWRKEGGGLSMELQPARWALRLLEGHAAHSMTALCVVRDADGRWLAGRRAAWLSTWAGKWALGAAGAVDLGESPVHTLTRELAEEWQLTPEALSVEALISLPTGLAMLVGMARVPAGSEPVADDEHDEFAWWPAEADAWPSEADERLRGMAEFLGG
jgi:ADP-ribose pyrophosphatase YjhB (NUDIX family)